ncbi:hypothetical protein C8F04DRAFT_1110697 [Mycena alexandri]|uniref:Arrestin-like N-terminal domain-containing protein n=1 Tax=Mycena alexandri TaxID=1745969 RepID=A0AAD6WXT3_9AGAR|nr:hypothetical protein C8F04DRAFT_1110697 [Mycena alexandri]
MADDKAADDNKELPAYSRAGPGPYRTEHKFTLENKGKPWLFLFIKSRAATPAAAPFFLENDVVAGRVELEADKSEAIKSITVTIQGGATAVGQEEQVFLDLNEVLWSDKAGKITKGKHSWPFSFTLPSKVDSPDVKGITLPPESKIKNAKLITVDAPPSFSERGSPAYIDYKALVNVKRGAFKPNQLLSANMNYLPLRQAEPPSALRQLAYKEGTDLIGPDGDPAGWKVLPPVKFKGRLFDAVDVELECTLAVATPLAFTIGSPIPLILTLKSENQQALDTLAVPNAVKLYLVRSIAMGSDAMQDDVVDRRSNSFFESNGGQAYFWPSNEGAQEPGKRVLRGELEVKRQTKPSFLFPRLTIRYTLDLKAFAITGFTSVGIEAGKSLLSEPVKITTKQIPGIAPRSYAPPGYEKPPESDFNSAVGYLENGNQRFYHHGGFA